MTVDAYTHKDFATLKQWWVKRGVEPPLASWLRHNGFVIRKDSSPIACAWLLRFQDIPVACIEWMTSKPGLPLRTSRKALRKLDEHISNVAIAHGIETIIGFAKDGAMVKEAEKRGYAEGVGPISCVFKEL